MCCLVPLRDRPVVRMLQRKPAPRIYLHALEPQSRAITSLCLVGNHRVVSWAVNQQRPAQSRGTHMSIERSLLQSPESFGLDTRP